MKFFIDFFSPTDCLKCLKHRDRSLLKNENKRIDNLQMKFANTCALKTCLESLQNQAMGLIFNRQSCQLLHLVLSDRRNLSGTLPKSTCGKSFSCRLSFSAARNAITKATEYVTFGFCFHIFVFSHYKLCLNVN